MSNFTPGPWKHEHNLPHCVWANDVWVASTNVETVPSFNTREANAILIAAAPDMYEALTMMLAQGGPLGTYGDCAFAKAKAALAKADGKPTQSPAPNQPA